MTDSDGPGLLICLQSAGRGGIAGARLSRSPVCGAGALDQLADFESEQDVLFYSGQTG